MSRISAAALARRGGRRIALFTAVGLLAVGLAIAGAQKAFAGSTTGQSAVSRTAIATTPDGTPYIAFSGTESGEHVHIGAISGILPFPGSSQAWNCACNQTNDTALGGTGPTLATAVIGGSTQVFVAWVGTDHHLNIAHYNGTATLVCHTTFGEESTHSPYMVSLSGSVIYLAWTGTDRHLNIATLNVGNCTNNAGRATEAAKSTLTDTSVAGPAITGVTGGGIAVAWSGTDSTKHIWTGKWFAGNTSLANHTCLCSYESSDDIGLVNVTNLNSSYRLIYRGTNNGVYIADSTNGYQYPSQSTDDGNLTIHGPDITADITDTTAGTPAEYDAFVGTDGKVNVDIVYS
jgi:hypothetical protein